MSSVLMGCWAVAAAAAAVVPVVPESELVACEASAPTAPSVLVPKNAWRQTQRPQPRDRLVPKWRYVQFATGQHTTDHVMTAERVEIDIHITNRSKIDVHKKKWRATILLRWSWWCNRCNRRNKCNRRIRRSKCRCHWRSNWRVIVVPCVRFIMIRCVFELSLRIILLQLPFRQPPISCKIERFYSGTSV